MSAIAAPPAESVQKADFTWKPPVTNGKFAMWVFLGTEIMFFTGLIGTYVVLRMGTDAWPSPAETLNVPLTALNTFFLICSSVTMMFSLKAIQQNDQGRCNLFLFLTIAIGALFVGIQMFEYSALISESFVPAAGVFPSTFYIMTGFHGAHVTAGVIILICVWLQSMRGRYNKRNYSALEIAGLYWHFVDLIWILLFTLVYLM
jgi:heme/copper-type cytochrome/quinol oxidase subunit 3